MLTNDLASTLMSRSTTITLPTAVLALFLALGLAVQPQARAQMDDGGDSPTIQIGPRVGIPFGDVSDIGGNLFFGAGGRVQISALPSEIVLSPSLDFYLTDDFAGAGLTIVAVDLNGFYEFQVEESPFVPYVGGGIAVTNISVDVENTFADPSTTEVGLNLVGGVRFPLDSVEPFAQFNFAAGADRIGVTGGILFTL
jgi:hypothetical protein